MQIGQRISAILIGLASVTSSAFAGDGWAVIQTSAARVDENAPASRQIVTKTETIENFTQKPETFISNLRAWLAANKQELKEQRTKIIRVVQDQNAIRFDLQQRQELSRLASEYGVKILFQKVRIDYDRRKSEAAKEETKKEYREALQKEASAELDRQIAKAVARMGEDEFRKQAKEVSLQIEKEVFDEFFAREGAKLSDREKLMLRQRFKDFWASVYEKPSGLELITGSIKGAFVIVLTYTAWRTMFAKYGLNPNVAMASPWMWLLCAKLLGSEVFFGPYIRIYLNFLDRHITSKFTAAGTAVWGNAQGFVLFSMDKLLLHLTAPTLITGPWDPKFLAGYFSLASIGSLFGSTMPTGVSNLVAKGYMSATQGSILMQAADLIMPLEGAFLSFGSPWFVYLFAGHQTFKFGVYVLSKAVPVRSMVTLIPEDLAKEGEINWIYRFGQMPPQAILSEQDALSKFLRSDYPMQTKLQFFEFLFAAAKKDQLPEDRFTNFLTAYTNYLTEQDFGNSRWTEFDELKKKSAGLTEDDFKRIENLGGPAPRLMLDKKRQEIRGRMIQIRSELKYMQKLAAVLLKPEFKSSDESLRSKLRALATRPLPEKMTFFARLGRGACRGVLSLLHIKG